MDVRTITLWGGPADGMSMEVSTVHPPVIRVSVPRQAPVPPGAEYPPSVPALRGDYTAAVYRLDPENLSRYVFDPKG